MEINAVKMKPCTKCKLDKPLSEFYKRHDSGDGYAYWCKICTQEHNNRLSDKSKRPHRDKFLKVATEWNREHPVVRSSIRAEHVQAARGL